MNDEVTTKKNMTNEGSGSDNITSDEITSNQITPDEITNEFLVFSGRGGSYYGRVFLALQKSTLSRFHLNWMALIGTFWWASVRGNRLLFWLGFLVDLMVLINLALVYKYATAAITFADKAYLVERYEGWRDSHMLGAILVFIFGRLFFSWLADRYYYFQYSRWRINNMVPSGFSFRRLLSCFLVVVMIVPLMLYRTSQFAPEARACVKQDRRLAAGEFVPLKDRFDCFFIGEFPVLFWLDRRDQITFPRDENGNRYVQKKPPREGLPPVNLNKYVAELIDDGIGYMTAFYGFLFDSITAFLRTMLSAITSLFVGTPWIITMGAILGIAYTFAGVRVTIFVASTLLYLAMFGFWQTAMDTLSLVTAASIICVVFGLPMGIWVGKSQRGKAFITPILDIMQTIPSFVYLLPAVAFFSIGKPPGILATVIFAMPPMVRLTALGVRHVPEHTKEAALAFGANPRQLLMKVELPLALPSIMAGVNQVVMMSLSMVVIAALIGAGGMGFIVTEALANTRTGTGILAGLGIALLAMMIDRIVQKANMR